MISILIPIYNFDVRQLVGDLLHQCKETGVGFEIICFDDGSAETYRKLNRTISGARVRYKEMPVNMGRSAIRNALGEAARFPYLLFMDCDSGVVKGDYIQTYLTHISPGHLLYGGRCYREDPPPNREQLFHWHYGSEREVVSAEKRQQEPYHGFMTNNFLVPKDIFLQVKFDESLTQYGHEDTLFGLELQKRQIPILHLSNPLEHIGLETTEVFLKKTRQGLDNLLQLWRKGAPIDTKLLRVFLKIRKWRGVWLAGMLYPVFKISLERRMRKGKVDLRIFDVYKLVYFCWKYGKIG